MTALTVSGLRLQSGSLVLVDGIDLRVDRGKVLALLGASGSGKTLTTLAMLDLLPPGVHQTAGTVAGAELRGRVVGLVQQSPRTSFNPLVTLGRHFRETLACDGLRGARAVTRATACLAEVGVDAPATLLPLYPFQLSGGMLQRAMIALALCRNPSFLLADEPTTDLDLVAQAQILDSLAGLRASRGIGILLVTHDLSVVARLADEVAVMVDGRIVEQQTVAGLFATPYHPVTRALLTAHLRLYGGVS